ncbi:hypothetical protein [Anaeromyxobacter diazotrophicus]|uniref:Uncharacterized protein n=1 Tax=Anaeromyxobacter diazotrophicus TaxID=2590199 RepID=A0A7I9VR54_9BACT|nr:hypothetical protein [Anaeromyxobacter diazotrophicus]GEJ58821.1 hypothetical protein AMYX_35620 [Anaeromyxobacter diazotrophicus]
MADRAPSTFSLWLDEALSSWILPVAALAAVAAVGGLYLAGFAGEEATATLVVLVVAALAAVFLVRPALDARREPLARGLAAAAAIATLVATLLPALRTVRPGEPLFAGDVGQVGDKIAVPPAAAGAVRLLVSGKLPERGEPSVTFTLGGTKEPVEGKLERTYGYARVGRGTRARVAHDHTADYYPADLPAGASALELERLQGQLGSRLAVAVFREPIPFAGGPWILAGLALLLACAADARLGQRNNLSVAAGMALAFALLVTYNATPAAAVGPSVGGVVLGGLAGSLAGWIVGALVRQVVPPAPRRTPAGKGKAVTAA